MSFLTKMEKLSDLPNIGPELEKRLLTIGISTAMDLKSMGSCKAYQGLRIVDTSTCINTLYALEGAIQNVRWHKLDTAKPSSFIFTCWKILCKFDCFGQNRRLRKPNKGN